MAEQSQLPPPGRIGRRLRWLAPVAVVGVVVGGVAIAAAGSSDATPSLPARSAAQLLTAVQRTSVTALSGKIHQATNLGVPSLPGDQASASLTPESFLTGSHTIRVWADGADKQRLAVIGQLSEADVVHHGRDIWTYVSDTNTVTHTVLPTGASSAHEQDRPSAADYTPVQVANRILKAVTPSTSVTVDTAQTVAGRAAYTLVLRPRDSRSTVRQVRIAIDATKFVPLQVQVYGSGSSPAFETGFTSISYRTPAASTFDFTKPAGATVSTDPFGANDNRHRDFRPNDAIPSPDLHVAPKVIGSGWTTIFELSGDSVARLSGGMLNDLTNPVGTSGERLLHTALLNAVLLPDGRAFVGAVSPAMLEHVAATTAS